MMVMTQPDYTVELKEVFQGPMDLLLHLVREQEVEIHEIEIGKILSGYLQYLEALESIDIEIAGDFLVMAATLMAIKSRSLLPTGEEVDLEAELDPRDELIQRLIEYRHFKGAAGDLGDRWNERHQLFERRYKKELDDHREEPTLDLSEITQWDLLATFSRLMRETLADRTLKIEADERPLRFFVEELIGNLKKRKKTSLSVLVEEAVERGQSSKPYMVGTFCALLKLIKLGAATVRQEKPGAEIEIDLRSEAEGDLEEIVRGMGFEDEVLTAEDDELSSGEADAVEAELGAAATPADAEINGSTADPVAEEAVESPPEASPDDSTPLPAE